MWFGFMSFRALQTELKQKNWHNSPNVQPIITYFQSLFKFMKRHLLFIFSKIIITCFVFVVGILHFYRFFTFNKFPTIFAIHLCDEYDSTKWISLNKIWHDKYVRQTLHKNTYMCSFLVWKKTVFELSRGWSWRWPCGGTPYMVFIGPVVHNTTKSCLKRIGHGGYE